MVEINYLSSGNKNPYGDNFGEDSNIKTNKIIVASSPSSG